MCPCMHVSLLRQSETLTKRAVQYINCILQNMLHDYIRTGASYAKTLTVGQDVQTMAFSCSSINARRI